MIQFSLTSAELWEDIEPKLIEIKERKNSDAILVDNLDALINHYNGNISKKMEGTILGLVGSIITMLSSKDYYYARRVYLDQKGVEELMKLAEDLEMFRKVLQREAVEALSEKEVEDIPERLPNYETDKIKNMYNYDGKIEKKF